MRFGVVVNGPTWDGVGFSVLADGRELWSGVHTQQDRPTMHDLDLTAYAGRTVAMTLRVDARGNHAADWANWLRPVVVSGPPAEPQ